MKKCMVFVVTMALLMAMTSFPVFAGDVPESLLYSDDAQIFFGEVTAYQPNAKNPTVTVTPLAVIKGDVEENAERIYHKPNPIGDFLVLVGGVYLFANYDDVNSMDIFEVTTYNTKTLKLRHVQDGTWERFEEYLNQGKYGEAKLEGINPYRLEIIWGAIAVAVCLSLVATVWICKKKYATPKPTE